MAQTKLANLINPQVMADIIDAKISKKIVVTPFAKIDTTLEGVAGNTISVPTYAYIGDAEDVAEGVACGTTTLTATTTTATVKKAMKAIELTDEAVLSGYGDPIGQATSQLAKSIASKVDNDCMAALLGVTTLNFDGSTSKISYNGVVDAIDLFEEEVNGEKVMFVNPKQLTDLRKDSNFISADKYTGNVIMTGEVGMICNTHIVPSKKVVLDATSAFYTCPIVKLETDAEVDSEAPALTIYLKRNVNLETERETLKRSTTLSVDEIYTAVVSNASKVVLAKFKK
ncbi:MAG: N4-gp56 family major capsid protein [Clostridium sp.]|uniref:N4-gp56 family major capsid protein n=1 Tax=Clostridium tertium TaxID=1559 RepID=A0A9X4AZN7_9CLOT|nr:MULTISPECIES: N4-gp56 family major capsid protein [Clostridium]MDC4240054.1 N4-gp56 family major capsid protein [Clostridium tertium]MDU3548946.1 N4-gp56 family major capsid protein [Clostridium sp.]MDU7243366.1 N4-gp56 family major capsid protein [Clostridium sp.]